MAQNTPAGPVIAAAIILGGAILGASFIIRSSLEHGTRELGELRAALAGVRSAIESGGAAPAAPQAAVRRRPDPNRRYNIDVGQAPVKGPESAKVTLVEWSDFQCPFCKRVTPTLEQIEETYGDDVRIVFKHLPLSIHPKAPAAHAAAEAARLQGKFWEMHDRIFANQSEMSPEKYAEWAGEMGLDVEKFRKDVASAQVKQRVDADARAASSLGVTGTPSFFVNGRFLSGAQPFESFKKVIDEELARG